jgi:hypothetical protein
VGSGPIRGQPAHTPDTRAPYLRSALPGGANCIQSAVSRSSGVHLLVVAYQQSTEPAHNFSTTAPPYDYQSGQTKVSLRSSNSRNSAGRPPSAMSPIRQAPPPRLSWNNGARSASQLVNDR